MKSIPKPSITELWERYGGTVAPARGAWAKATCVIHEDKNPSASVNEDECRFNCWVCDLSGDAIDLIMAVENVGWADAKRVADELADADGSSVRAGSGGSSLLPRRSGHRPGRSNWTPPWLGR